MVPRLFSLLSKMKGRIPSNKFRSACIYIYIYSDDIPPVVPCCFSPPNVKGRIPPTPFFFVIFPWPLWLFHLPTPRYVPCTIYFSHGSIIVSQTPASCFVRDIPPEIPWLVFLRPQVTRDPKHGSNITNTRCLFTTDTFKTEGLAKSMKSGNIY